MTFSTRAGTHVLTCQLLAASSRARCLLFIIRTFDIVLSATVGTFLLFQSFTLFFVARFAARARTAVAT